MHDSPFVEGIFTTIRSPNPLEETMARISGAIKSRLFQPGDRLPAERELAKQLGVSRSTLRVALQNLVDDGWLEVRRGRHGGSFVTQWPQVAEARQLPEILQEYSHQLAPLLDYRRAIESSTAGFAAERATVEELEELEALTKTFGELESTFDQYRSIDSRWHIMVAQLSHSPRLVVAITEIQASITEVLDAIVYHAQPILQQSTEYHWQILRAIQAHDAEQATALMQNHVRSVENVIYSFMPEILPQRFDHYVQPAETLRYEQLAVN